MTAGAPHAALAPRTRAFTLAALATAFPSDELDEVLDLLGEDLVAHEGLAPLRARLREGLDLLRADYLACFETGRERVPLYETEYGRMRGLSKGKDLADVVGFYNAFGFDLLADPSPEMPDHVAIELEFYALLLYKQALLADDPEGSDIVEDARKKFLVDHLGGFIPALARRGPVADHPVYGPVLEWCAAIVAEECRLASVRPAPLDFFAPDEASEGVACGGCVAIPGADRPKAAEEPQA